MSSIMLIELGTDLLSSIMLSTANGLIVFHKAYRTGHELLAYCAVLHCRRLEVNVNVMRSCNRWCVY